MPAGRPSKYKPEYAKQAEKLAKLGATDRELADFFEVVESTLNLWKIEHPEFSESLKLGKEIPDQRVERSLYQRALGYSHEEVDIRVVNNEIQMTPIIKHYPPDPTSAIFWLKNRKSDNWRDKQELEHSGNIIIERVTLG